MKDSARKMESQIVEEQSAVADDGVIDQALLELDAKLAAWTRSMMKAEDELKDRVRRSGSPGLTKLDTSSTDEAHVVDTTMRRPEPPRTTASRTTVSSADGLNGAARLAALRPRAAKRPDPLTDLPFDPLSDPLAGSLPEGIVDQLTDGGVGEGPADDGSQWRPAEDAPLAPLAGQARATADFADAPLLDVDDENVEIVEDWAASYTGPDAASASTDEESWPSGPDWPGQDQAAPVATDWKPGEGDDWQPNSDGRRPNPAAEIEKELREKLKRAAAEDEQHLKTLDSSLASRVRKLRRLDPYADIEELVERAREAQREADSDKTPRSKGSWWRRS
jgi:hypothetical protein